MTKAEQLAKRIAAERLQRIENERKRLSGNRDRLDSGRPNDQQRAMHPRFG
jgi:hypothetical protein